MVEIHDFRWEVNFSGSAPDLNLYTVKLLLDQVTSCIRDPVHIGDPASIKHEARLAEIPPSHKRVYCYVGGIFTGHNTAIDRRQFCQCMVYENAATAENRP